MTKKAIEPFRGDEQGIIEAFRKSTPSSFPKSFIGNPEAYTEGRFLPQ